MTNEKTGGSEEFEIKVGDEIPFEDESSDKAKRKESDMVEDLRKLGQQFAETIRVAWNSEERKEFEREMREGFQTFAGEVDKAFKDIKESESAKKMKEEAKDFKTKAESGEVVNKTRSSISQGLRWFSEELAKAAESFTPSEKQAPAEETPEAGDE